MAKRKPLPTFTGHCKAFVNLLKEAAYNRSTWEVFRDFTQLAALSFANASDGYQILNGVKVWNDRESEYQQTINKYNAKTRELFPKMLAELVNEFQDNADAGRYMDVLGEIFEGLGFNNEWRGQYFTPIHIAEMTAKITLNDKVMREKIAERGYFTVLEPCVGSGAILIGVINTMLEMRLNPSRQVLIVGNDIDIRCCYMAYVQLTLCGVPAVILHQNALTNEILSPPFYTPIFAIEGWQRRLSLLKEAATDIKPADNKQVQISLNF